MKEMFKRAIRTFFQAFIGFLAVNLTTGIAEAGNGRIFLETLAALVASGVAAGLAAVMNMPKRGE